MTPRKDDYDEKYTDPELRRKLKAEIEASSKGGKKGQWSARKSQLLVREYEKQGGGYKGEKSDDAKSLEAWTDENWMTQDGSADARREDGSTKRYLPEKAWDLLSDEEKREAERKKREGNKEGQQYVENTLSAKEARKRVQAEGKKGGKTRAALLEEAKKRNLKGRSAMSKAELERALAE